MHQQKNQGCRGGGGGRCVCNTGMSDRLKVWERSDQGTRTARIQGSCIAGTGLAGGGTLSPERQVGSEEGGGKRGRVDHAGVGTLAGQELTDEHPSTAGAEEK